ncbi:MAG: COG1361 S-layer family protein [Halobacteriales archaeon]
MAVVAIAAVLLLSGAAAGEGESVTRYEDPDLVPNVEGENVVGAGETVTVNVSVQNRGSYVGDARAPAEHFTGVESVDTPGAAIGAVAEFGEGDAPFDVRSGVQRVGTVTPRGSSTVGLTFEVDEDAEPGVYEVPVTFDYEYVSFAVSDDMGTSRSYEIIRSDETERETVRVRVEDTVDLDVSSVRGEGLRAGDDGRVTATVRNDGLETARDARLRLVDSSPFEARDTSKHVGELSEGESATTSFRVSVSDTYTKGDAAAKFALEYEDENGVTRETEPETAGVGVAGDADFSVDAEAEAMYVDSVGAVHATVTNVGDTAVENARFVLRESPPFQPVSSKASLDNLAPGESTTASFRVEVSDRAVAQQYPVEGHVEYQDGFNETRTSDVTTDSVEIGEERDFSVTGSPTVSAGATEKVEFTVENTGGGPMRDAVARINVDSPLSTDDDTTYLGDLAPGESTNVTYRVSVDSGATAKDYSTDVVIKYDNAFGDKVVTDIRKAPVEVEDSVGIIGRIVGIFA